MADETEHSPDAEGAGPEREARCGFVALVGVPNAGKSTLLNQLVGSKVSIVTPKPQTTRMRVLGVRMEDDAQIVFIDTPGIFSPKRRLDRAMVRTAWREAGDADIACLVVDAARGFRGDDREIARRLGETGRPLIAVLNKVDAVARSKLLGLAAAMNAVAEFKATFMVSALTGDGVEDLGRELGRLAPEGPWMFPEDQISDQTLRVLAAEITREQVFLQLHAELPYSATVETESWEEFQNGDVAIRQAILVERPTQKAIVLGKGGSRIKKIRTEAQAALEENFGRRVHLFLFVGVRENWSEDPDRFREMGLDFDA